MHEKKEHTNNIPEDFEEDLELRKAEIEKAKTKNLEFIAGMLERARKHIETGDRPDVEWSIIAQEWTLEQELIQEIMDHGKEKGVLIDPKYYLIPMAFAKRLGPERLQAIKYIVDHFIPLETLQEYLREIDVQADEGPYTSGFEGVFDSEKRRAEVPKYVTFDSRNPENFYATLIHEAVGHPTESMMHALPPEQWKQILEAHGRLRRKTSFFKGSFGRSYPSEIMADSPEQFMAEFMKQYCLDRESLQEHIQKLPPTQRDAYQTIYDFVRTNIYQGREFGPEDIKPLEGLSQQIKEKYSQSR